MISNFPCIWSTEDVSTADAVRGHLLRPNGTASMDVCQWAMVIDQLPGCAEVNFRTLCDLVCYQQFKAAGTVSCVEEFLTLTHPDELAYLIEEGRE